MLNLAFRFLVLLYSSVDVVAMVDRSYPYHNNSIKPELRYAIAFHHIPGIFLPFFLFSSGLHESHNLQNIAAWLLLAAAFGAYAKDAVKAALTNNINLAFYIYARFYLFPKDSLTLLEFVKAMESTLSNPANYILYVGGFLLFIFNLVILGEFVVKTTVS